MRDDGFLVSLATHLRLLCDFQPDGWASSDPEKTAWLIARKANP